jgi:hypothetical protein
MLLPPRLKCIALLPNRHIVPYCTIIKIYVTSGADASYYFNRSISVKVFLGGRAGEGTWGIWSDSVEAVANVAGSVLINSLVSIHGNVTLTRLAEFICSDLVKSSRRAYIKRYPSLLQKLYSPPPSQTH